MIQKKKKKSKKGKINYLKIDAKRKSRELLIFKKSRNRNNDEKFLFQTMHVFHYLDTLFNILKKEKIKNQNEIKFLIYNPHLFQQLVSIFFFF